MPAMRLFEAIIEANSRAVAGDQNAGVHVAEFESELPVVALTCVDPRLNRLMPGVLGVPEESFIWLRNAGNIITAPLSSTMRSLALACAVKGGKEIAIIGHTDCQVCKTTTTQLLDKLKALGVERRVLPENINDYFGMFGSERQNVIKACDIVRHSPLIGPKVPVHGLVVDIQTGKLDWIVNGYDTLATVGDRWTEVVRTAGETVDKLKSLTDFQIGEMKFPETKIGETVTKAEDWLAKGIETIGTKVSESPAANVASQVVELAQKNWPQSSVTPPTASPSTPTLPPKRIPIPPPIRPRPGFTRGKK